MTKKAEFNAEEWSTILEGPATAGMIVVAAEKGGTIRESMGIAKAYAEAAKDIGGTAKTFSTAAGFPERVMEVALARRSFRILPISSPVIGEQQKIADTFKDLGLIPAAINVSDAMRK